MRRRTRLYARASSWRRLSSGCMSLFDRGLLIVSGKGGVGKSTVAAALGMASAGRGRRTLLVEVASQERMSRLFDQRDPIGYHVTPVYPGAGRALGRPPEGARRVPARPGQGARGVRADVREPRLRLLRRGRPRPARAGHAREDPPAARGRPPRRRGRRRPGHGTRPGVPERAADVHADRAHRPGARPGEGRGRAPRRCRPHRRRPRDDAGGAACERDARGDRRPARPRASRSPA